MCSRTSCKSHASPCGFYGDATKERRYTPAIIQRYPGKISGPLLDRVLAARTIADLSSSDSVPAKHVAEAVQYQSPDRNYWS